MKTIFIAEEHITNHTPEADYSVNSSQLTEKIKDKMAAGVAHFTFKKKDGSTREAYGTLNPSYLPGGSVPENKNPNTQTYFDLEAKAWRMFTISQAVALF